LGVLNDRQYKENILDFHFKIKLNPNETKNFYLKVSSLSSAVFFNLTLMEKTELLDHEFYHQMILNMFFVSILTLMIYNLFIYFFTRKIEYVYYVLYLFVTIWNYSAFTGISYLIIDEYFHQIFTAIDAFLGIVNLSLILIFALLFTRSFLNIKKYKKIDFIFKSMIIISIILIFISFFFYPFDIVAFLVLLGLLFMVLVSYYLLYKKEDNARYFVVGWTIATVGWIMLATYTFGIFSLIEEYPYFYELCIFIEALLFSMALSSKLNTTDQLKKQVNINEILTQELNHRVKNNMHIITIFINHQLRQTKLKDTKESLEDIKSKIYTINKVHEMLLLNEDAQTLDTEYYFEDLCSDIIHTYSKDVDLDISCHVSLDKDRIVYVGLILNEIVVNACKYAFIDGTGTINITLEKIDKRFVLIVKDDGIGFEPKESRGSKGLYILKVLVEDQLKGTLDISSDNGTKIMIRF